MGCLNMMGGHSKAPDSGKQLQEFPPPCLLDEQDTKIKTDICKPFRRLVGSAIAFLQVMPRISPLSLIALTAQGNWLPNVVTRT